MNVWILTSQFPPTVIGGIARYVENAATMFASAGHTVTVIAADRQDDETTLPSGARLIRFRPHSSRNDTAEQAAGSPLHPAFPYNIMSHWPALGYQLAERLAALARRDGALPDIVECQEYGALPYYLMQRRLIEDHPLREVPLVVHLQSPDFALTRANQEPRYSFPSYWVERMEKFCFLEADALLASSHFMQREIACEMPELATPITVIPLPYGQMPQLNTAPTPGDLVYFGRLQVLKGVPPLVQVCDALWSQGQQFRLTLMGLDTRYATEDMMMSSYLRQRYGHWVERGLLIIQQDQRLSEAELWERLSRAWAVLIPSLWENYPNACIEAMGLGKLVIASRSGGQAEMIGEDGQAGLLFDWQREGDCAAAITRALSLDTNAVQAIGQTARERISATTGFESVLPQRVAHYEEVIRRGRTRRTVFPCLTQAANAGVDEPDHRPDLLSVVVTFDDPTCDLSATLTSILTATYRQLELLVMASSISAATASAIISHLPERAGVTVRLLTSAKREPDALCYEGAAAAAGATVAFVRAGDIVDTTLFERALTVFERFDNVGFVYSWVADHQQTQCHPNFNSDFPYLLLHNMVPSTVVVRRNHYVSAIRRTPPLGFGAHQHSLWIDLVEHGHIGVCLPDVLAHCRQTIEQSSNTDERATLAQVEIAERHKAEFQRYSVEIAGLLNANGSSNDWTHPALPAANYRRLYQELFDRHERLKRRLGFVAPIATALQSLLRRRRKVDS